MWILRTWHSMGSKDYFQKNLEVLEALYIPIFGPQQEHTPSQHSITACLSSFVIFLGRLRCHQKQPLTLAQAPLPRPFPKQAIPRAKPRLALRTILCPEKSQEGHEQGLEASWSFSSSSLPGIAAAWWPWPLPLDWGTALPDPQAGWHPAVSLSV